jgi:hypothetical protein
MQGITTTCRASPPHHAQALHLSTHAAHTQQQLHCNQRTWPPPRRAALDRHHMPLSHQHRLTGRQANSHSSRQPTCQQLQCSGRTGPQPDREALARQALQVHCQKHIRHGSCSSRGLCGLLTGPRLRQLLLAGCERRRLAAGRRLEEREACGAGVLWRARHLDVAHCQAKLLLGLRGGGAGDVDVMCTAHQDHIRITSGAHQEHIRSTSGALLV